MTALKEMSIVYRDDLPYPDPRYLRYRIKCDAAEAQRWRSRASSADGGSSGALARAYLTHAYVAEMRIARRQRVLIEMGEPTLAPLPPPGAPNLRSDPFLRPKPTEQPDYDSSHA